MKALFASLLASSPFVFAIFGSASAATLARYTFGTTYTLAPSAAETSATAGSLTNAGGLNLHDSGGNFATSGARALGVGGDGAGLVQVSHSEAEAVTNNDFIGFDVTAAAGTQLTVTGFSFYANLGNAASIANNFSVRMINAGVNGGAAVVLGGGEITKVVGGAGAGTADGQLFDLSFGAYTGLTGTTTFQILLYDTDTAVTTWSGNWVRLDDIQVTGTVGAIPEASVTLLCIPAAALLLRRRKR